MIHPNKHFIRLQHSGRSPLKADQYLLKQLSKFNMLPVLTNVKADYLEDSGATVIRKRSIFRVWAKRILSLQFKAKKMEIV